MKNTTKNSNGNSDFFGTTEIPISVSYDFLPLPEPMRFFLRIQMDREEREARQKLLAMPAAQREAKLHEHNVELLHSLSTRPPENVPTFEGDIKTFFSGENAMKKKVVEDALALYFAKTQPEDFFR